MKIIYENYLKYFLLCYILLFVFISSNSLLYGDENTFPDDYLLIKNTYASWDGSSWDYHQQISKSYNELNQLIEETKSILNGGIIYSNKYNYADGKLFVKKLYLPSFNNFLYLDKNIYFFYDLYKNLKEETTWENPESNDSIITNTINYSYDSFNRLISMTQVRRDESVLVNYRLNELTYYNNDSLFSETEYRWDNSQKKWFPDFKNVYNYYPFKKEILVYRSGHELVSKNVILYDSLMRWSKLFDYKWDKKDSLFRNSSRIFIDYFSEPNIVSWLFESWIDSIWTPTNRILIEYDYSKLLTEQYNQSWVDSAWQNNSKLINEYKAKFTVIFESSLDVEGIQIFPNPATSNFISINADFQSEFGFTITDLLGNVCFSKTIPKDSGKNITLALPYLPVGLYLLHVKSNSTNIVKPIILLK